MCTISIYTQEGAIISKTIMVQTWGWCIGFCPQLSLPLLSQCIKCILSFPCRMLIQTIIILSVDMQNENIYISLVSVYCPGMTFVIHMNQVIGNIDFCHKNYGIEHGFSPHGYCFGI
jgi:hypothetical protein